MVDGLITINGKQYFLKYDMNILCEMKMDGFDAFELMNGEMTVDFIKLRTFFFYGLKLIQSSVVKTKEDAGELMSRYLESEGTIEELTEVAMKALARSLGYKQMDAPEGK